MRADEEGSCAPSVSATVQPSAVPAEEIAESSVDRGAIRRSRKDAAKRAKRLIRDRFNAILRTRPPGSQPADKILRHAVSLYDDGPIDRSKLKGAIARLESIIRADLPDLAVIRGPKSASAKPRRVGLMIYETRAIIEEGQQFVTAENHSVILTDKEIVFISGLLPGGTRPHLFERVYERGSASRMLADIQIDLSSLWPTLIWMRSEQRIGGRGEPLSVMMTPFEDGLLFGSLVKVDGVPAAGPTVAIVGPHGQQTRTLWDFYGDGHGKRLWAMTNTFVDHALLEPRQVQLRDMLSTFVHDYADVVADNDWRWRFGFGLKDPAVLMVAETFKVIAPVERRRRAALAALESIVNSEPWQREAARSQASQDCRRPGAPSP